MKLEIEITDEEIKSAMERKVRTAIADQSNQWGTDKFIKETVESEWKRIVGEMVEDELGKFSVMREKIIASIEAKIRGQVTALMKAKARPNSQNSSG
jgi:transcriptional accessory protein Tex/SPT6